MFFLIVTHFIHSFLHSFSTHVLRVCHDLGTVATSLLAFPGHCFPFCAFSVFFLAICWASYFGEARRKQAEVSERTEDPRVRKSGDEADLGQIRWQTIRKGGQAMAAGARKGHLNVLLPHPRDLLVRADTPSLRFDPSCNTASSCKCVSAAVQNVLWVIRLNPHNSLWDECCCYSHLTEEETEAC